MFPAFYLVLMTGGEGGASSDKEKWLQEQKRMKDELRELADALFTPLTPQTPAPPAAGPGVYDPAAPSTPPPVPTARPAAARGQSLRVSPRALLIKDARDEGEPEPPEKFQGEGTPITAPAPSEPAPTEAAPHEAIPRATAPQEPVPPEIAPQETEPQATDDQVSDPQVMTMEESVPPHPGHRRSDPQEKAMEGTAPSATTPTASLMDEMTAPSTAEQPAGLEPDPTAPPEGSGPAKMTPPDEPADPVGPGAGEDGREHVPGPGPDIGHPEDVTGRDTPVGPGEMPGERSPEGPPDGPEEGPGVKPPDGPEEGPPDKPVTFGIGPDGEPLVPKRPFDSGLASKIGAVMGNRWVKEKRPGHPDDTGASEDEAVEMSEDEKAAASSIEQARGLLDGAPERLELDTPIELLKEARAILKEGDPIAALSLAEESIKLTKSVRKLYADSRSQLKKAQKVLMEKREAKVDIAHVVPVFKKAKRRFNQGRYKEAADLSTECIKSFRTS